MEIVIVGNGIIGLQTAYQLTSSDKSVKVAVVGDFAHQGCASLAAAAMFNSFCEIDSGTFKNKYEEQKWLFNRMANSYWPILLEQIREESGSTLASGFGTYLINNTVSDALEDENFDSIIEALDRFAEPYSKIRPSEIPLYQPSPAHRATRAIFIDREGWVNPIHLFECLKLILRKRPNVRFIDGLCHRLEYDQGSDAISEVVLADGSKVRGDKFIVCPGANFSKIIDQSKLPINFQRVFYGVGATVLLQTGQNTLSNCIRTPNRGLACGIYSAPQDSNHTIIGASNLIAPEPFPSARVISIYTLLQAAIEQINMDYYRADLVRINVGWRPTSSDTLPMIGRTGIKNLLVATGTKRDGLHCSPIISRYLNDLALCDRSKLETEFDFTNFRPDRTPIKIWTRSEAIELAVRHAMNAAYQHDFVPAKSTMINDIKSYYQTFFEDLHEKVGAKEFGIPPEMKDMFRYGHLQPEHFEN